MAIFGHRTALEIASHADVLRGLSRVPAPLKSPDLSGKTYTYHNRLPVLRSALWTERNFAFDLAPEKIRKVSWKVKTLQFQNKLIS